MFNFIKSNYFGFSFYKYNSISFKPRTLGKQFWRTWSLKIYRGYGAQPLIFSVGIIYWKFWYCSKEGNWPRNGGFIPFSEKLSSLGSHVKREGSSRYTRGCISSHLLGFNPHDLLLFIFLSTHIWGVLSSLLPFFHHGKHAPICAHFFSSMRYGLKISHTRQYMAKTAKAMRSSGVVMLEIP